MMSRRLRVFRSCLLGLVGVAAAAAAGPAYAASPLVAPGDYRFRHDVQLLQDAGVLTGPVSTWPVSLPQLHAALSDFEGSTADLGTDAAGALARVRARVRRSRRGGAGMDVSVRGGSELQFLRSFADTPRGDAEGEVGFHWTGDWLAGELRVAGVADDPADDENLRFDGSWIGAAWGNWMLAGGKIQRSWGPAWQGGLLISNNARPRAGVTLRRMRSEPFETKWLSWLGPWHLSTFVERLEEDRGVPNALLWGMRFAFRPFQSLEIGVSRASQFGGEGNDVGFDTVVNVLTGQTTTGNSAVGSAEDINQLGGGDFRWNLPYVNAALFGEFIGEDESGSRPDLFMGQGGLELWGGLGETGSWRLIFERVDTKADIFDSSNREGDAEFGIAFNNSDFATGFRFRDRVIGHPAEGDALLSSTRLLLQLDDGSFVNVAYLDGDLNRAEGRRPSAARKNTLTTVNEEVQQVELSWQKQYRFGKLEFGVGHTVREPSATRQTDSDTFGWVGVDRRF